MTADPTRSPTRARSLERTVARMQWAAVALVALTTVLVGGAVGAFTSLREEDATSLSLARALVNELNNHAADTPEALDTEIRSELKEQAAFGRQVAIYLDARLIGATDIGRDLPSDTRPLGACRSEPLQGKTWRACSAAAITGAIVTVAAPLDQLTAPTETLVTALIVAALVTSALFGLLSRRIVRRSLRPLEEFRSGVAAIRANTSTELSFDLRWGVSEVDSVAQAFHDLLGRVRLAVDRERRFVADASHELRTPLTRIRGQLDLLAIEPSGPDSVKTLQAAQRSCDLLVRTTEALLALAREEAALIETVDMSEIASAVQAEQSQRDDAADARLTLRAADEALVRGDPHLLRLAVSNLVENALKYSDGPVTIRVGTVAHAPGDSSIGVAVEDEGPGIADSDAKRLLQPFARGASRVRGTGLGLALVDHVARVHGGEVRLTRTSPGFRASLIIPPWRPTVARG